MTPKVSGQCFPFSSADLDAKPDGLSFKGLNVDVLMINTIRGGPKCTAAVDYGGSNVIDSIRVQVIVKLYLQPAVENVLSCVYLTRCVAAIFNFICGYT